MHKQILLLEESDRVNEFYSSIACVFCLFAMHVTVGFIIFHCAKKLNRFVMVFSTDAMSLWLKSFEKT